MQERVEEANGERFDLLRGERVERAVDRSEVERHTDRAVRQYAMRLLEAELPAHEGTRLGGGQIVERRPPLPGDVEEIAEAARGDETRARAVPLEQRVGGDGRAVRDVAHAGRRSGRRGEDP